MAARDTYQLPGGKGARFYKEEFKENKNIRELKSSRPDEIIPKSKIVKDF